MYKTQVKPDHYDFKTYLPLERWISYYHQISNLVDLRHSANKSKMKVLIIGVGDNIVPKVLTQLGFTVKTLDLDSSLKPDYLQALPDIKIKEKFDCILCSQVLEHINYKDVEESIKQFSKICNYLIISVPNRDISFSLIIKPWFFNLKKIMFTFFNPFNFKIKGNGQHYWEIGDKKNTSKTFIRSASIYGFECIENYRVHEFPYHHFFVFEVKK